MQKKCLETLNRILKRLKSLTFLFLVSLESNIKIGKPVSNNKLV